MMHSPDKQLTLHPMSRISGALSIAHVEPALTEERTLLLQEFVARETAEVCRLGGGEGHRVIMEDELVTCDVSGGHNHPPHPRPSLHQPGVARGAILVRILCCVEYSFIKLILTLALWMCSCLSQKLIESHN